MLLVILDKGDLHVGNGVLGAGNHVGVVIDVGPDLIGKGQELLLGDLAAKGAGNDLLGGSAVKAVAENGFKSLGQVSAIVDSTAEGLLSNGQSAELGPSLPVGVEISGSLVGVHVAVADVDHIGLIQLLVGDHVLGNAGEARFAVGGGTAVQQAAGQTALGQTLGQFLDGLDVLQHHVVSHTEGHQRQLGVAGAVQNGITDLQNGGAGSGPLFVTGIGAVHHDDDFVMLNFGIAGDLDLDFVGVFQIFDLFVGLQAQRRLNVGFLSQPVAGENHVAVGHDAVFQRFGGVLPAVEDVTVHFGLVGDLHLVTGSVLFGLGQGGGSAGDIADVLIVHGINDALPLSHQTQALGNGFAIVSAVSVHFQALGIVVFGIGPAGQNVTVTGGTGQFFFGGDVAFAVGGDLSTAPAAGIQTAVVVIGDHDVLLLSSGQTVIEQNGGLHLSALFLDVRSRLHGSSFFGIGTVAVGNGIQNANLNAVDGGVSLDAENGKGLDGVNGHQTVDPGTVGQGAVGAAADGNIAVNGTAFGDHGSIPAVDVNIAGQSLTVGGEQIVVKTSLINVAVVRDLKGLTQTHICADPVDALVVDDFAAVDLDVGFGALLLGADTAAAAAQIVVNRAAVHNEGTAGVMDVNHTVPVVAGILDDGVLKDLAAVHGEDAGLIHAVEQAVADTGIAKDLAAVHGHGALGRGQASVHAVRVVVAHDSAVLDGPAAACLNISDHAACGADIVVNGNGVEGQFAALGNAE